MRSAQAHIRPFHSAHRTGVKIYFMVDSSSQKKCGKPLLPAQITCSGYAGMILARKHFMKIGAAAHAHGAHAHCKHVHHVSAANGHSCFPLSFGIVVGIILLNTYFVNMLFYFL